MVCQYNVIVQEFIMTYKNVTTELLPDWLRTTITGEVEYNPFLFSAIGSVLVGLSGVLPLLIIPIDETANLKQGSKFLTAASY